MTYSVLCLTIHSAMWVTITLEVLYLMESLQNWRDCKIFCSSLSDSMRFFSHLHRCWVCLFILSAEILAGIISMEPSHILFHWLLLLNICEFLILRVVYDAATWVNNTLYNANYFIFGEYRNISHNQLQNQLDNIFTQLTNLKTLWVWPLILWSDRAYLCVYFIVTAKFNLLHIYSERKI